MLTPVELNDAVVRMLDQRKLPLEETWIELEVPASLKAAWEQCAIDGRRLRQEAAISSGKLEGHYREMWTSIYALVAIVAAAEVWSGTLRRRLAR